MRSLTEGVKIFTFEVEKSGFGFSKLRKLRRESMGYESDSCLGQWKFYLGHRVVNSGGGDDGGLGNGGRRQP